MTKVITFLATFLVAVLIAACSSNNFTPVSGHPCPSPKSNAYYMQCRSGGIGVPSPHQGAVFGAQFGVDFAWGGPSGPTAKSLGAHFGASYLSGSSKDWTYALAQSYKNAGLGVVLVWETSAARSLDGYSAGYSDAYNATHEANRLGFKTGHIDYASDYDSGPYGSRFVSYYQGAVAWDRRAGFTTGAYGGLHTVNTLCADHITTLNWQTIGWSGGRRATTACAPLFQSGINDSFDHYSVDNDIAYAANYGQVNFVAPVAPVARLICFGHNARLGNKTCKQVYAEVAKNTQAIKSSQRVYLERGCVVLQQRIDYFSSKLHKYPQVKTQFRKHALATTHRVYAKRACGVFKGRVAYFAQLNAALHKKY